MATSIGTIEGRLKLRDQFTGAMKRATSQLEQSGRKMEKVGRRMSEVGGTLTRSVTLPLVAIGGAAVKSFADFDDAMNQSLAIMGDVSKVLRDDMAGAARKVAKETVFSAEQAAESYFFLASAGLDAAQSIEAMPQVAAFAQAGMFDMARATDLLTDAQSALGLTVQDTAENTRNMARVSDVLVKANTLANASVEQFSTALTSKAGAALKSFNIDIEEGAAVLAAFADQGVKAELAGNSLDRILRLLPSAANKNAAEFKRLEVDVFDPLTGNMRNLADIIADLEGALEGLTDKQKQATLEALGFEARIQGMIKPLLGTSDAVRQYEKELRNAAGTTQEVADKQLESFKKQMGLVKDQLVDAALTLGQGLAPIIQDFAEGTLVPAIEKLAKMAEGFGNLERSTQGLIVAVGAVAAAFGPLLFVTGQLITAWGALAQAAPRLAAALTRVISPVGLLTAAIAGLGIAANEAINKWRRSSEEGIAAIIAANNRAKESVKQLRQELETGVVSGRTFEELANSAFGLERAIASTEDKIADLRGQMSKTTLGEMQGLRDEIEEQEEKLSNLRSEYVVVQKALKDVGDATIDFGDETEDAKDAVEDLTNGLSEMSKEAKDALEAIEDQTKATDALVDALLSGSEEYDKLNILLDAGVPLEEALTGAFDDQAKKLLELQKMLDKLIENRERSNELAEEAAELERELNDAIEEAMGRQDPLDIEKPFTMEGIAPVREAVEAIRREEEQRKAILQEINILLQEGTITQEEAAEAAKKLGVETEKRTEDIADTWARIGGIMADAVQDHNSGLANTIRGVTQLIAMWKQIKTLQEQGASAVEQAAAGMAFGAALGQTANSLGIGRGDRGRSQFGGQMSGDFSDVGATIGGLFGPWGAVIGLALGAAIKKGADEARFEIISKGTETITSIKALEGGLHKVGSDAAKAFADAVEGALGLIDGEIASAPNIDVKIRNNMIKVWVGAFKDTFSDMEEAIGFAVTALLRQAELTGISPEVRATLENTTARTFDELEKELAVALRSRDIKLGEARASIRRGVEDFFELFQDEFEQGIISATGTSAGLIGMVGMFEENFNRLMGIQEDAGEVARRQAEAHNAELKLAIAKLKVTQAQMKADVAQMKTEMALIEGLSAETKAALAAAEAHGAFGKVLLTGAKSAIARAEAEMEIINATLDAIAAIDEALASLEGLEVDVDAAAAAARRAAASGPSNAEKLADSMASIERSLLPSFARQMAELHLKYEELIRLAGKDSEALARLNELRRQEAELIRQQATDELFEQGIKPFEQVGPAADARAPLRDIRQEADKLRKQAEEWAKTMAESAEESGKFFDEAGRLEAALDRIAAAEQRRIDALAKNIAVDLFGSLADLIEDEELRNKLLLEMEKIRFTLEMEQLRAQFIMLKELGKLTQAQIQMVNEAFEFIDANTDKILRSRIPTPGTGAGGGRDNAARERDNAMQRLLDIIARSLSPFEQAIRRTVDEFAELRRTLGFTQEVQQAYAQEIQRVLREQLEPIRRMQDELAFRADAPMRTIDQFRLAQKQLNESLAALRSGDLSQVDKIPELARRVLDLNPAAQGSEGNRFIFDLVDRALEEAQRAAEDVATGIEPGGPNDPFAWLRHEPTAGDDAVSNTLRTAANQIVRSQDETTDAIKEGNEERRKQKPPPQDKVVDIQGFRPAIMENLARRSNDIAENQVALLNKIERNQRAALPK